MAFTVAILVILVGQALGVSEVVRSLADCDTFTCADTSSKNIAIGVVIGLLLFVVDAGRYEYIYNDEILVVLLKQIHHLVNW